MVDGALLPGGSSALRADDPWPVGPYPLVGRVGGGDTGAGGAPQPSRNSSPTASPSSTLPVLRKPSLR